MVRQEALINNGSACPEPFYLPVEVKVMSLKEVRDAAAAVLLFLEENRSSSQAAAREICDELSRMTLTARHVQPSVAELFRRASGSV